MSISEKKIELVQNLLLLQDKAVLFEIEKLIVRSFRIQNTRAPQVEEIPVTFEVWVMQFEAPAQSDTVDEFDMSPNDLRRRIWSAEQSDDMSLETFWEQVVRN